MRDLYKFTIFHLPSSKAVNVLFSSFRSGDVNRALFHSGQHSQPYPRQNSKSIHTVYHNDIVIISTSTNKSAMSCHHAAQTSFILFVVTVVVIQHVVPVPCGMAVQYKSSLSTAQYKISFQIFSLHATNFRAQSNEQF